MAKKITTIPFGGEIPPELAELFDELVAGEGWQKKRALAAAVRHFISASSSDRAQWYRTAYDPPENPSSTKKK